MNTLVSFAVAQRDRQYTYGGDAAQAFDCTNLVRASTATLEVPAEYVVPGGGTFIPSLVTVPNVELIEVGMDWECSTGVFTFDEADLVSAIESQQDPAVRTPVVKLGHVDPRFDGQPALGRIENLRLTNNNQTLVGDLVGVPQWLGACMFSAYPRRSVEGNFALATRTGNLWEFALSAVALLGAEYPAIDTLDDIKALWGSEMPVMRPVEDVQEIAASGNFVRARRVEANVDVKWRNRKDAQEVQASATVDDIISAFYDTLGPTQMWWWVRTVLVNPLQLIVDDDMGNLWEYPVITDADDNISFGDPGQVKVEYVAASGMPDLRRSPGQVIAASYQAAADTGREVRVIRAAQAPEEEEERTMLTEDALRRLGLQPGATDEEISAAVAAITATEQPTAPATPAAEPTAPAAEPVAPAAEPVAPAAEPAAPAAEPVAPAVPEGMTLIDNTTLTDLQQGVAASNALIAANATRERDEFIAAACREGKFARSRVEHFTKLWASDPQGTRELITSLGAGVVPVEQIGLAGETDPAVLAAASAYPESWNKRVAAARGKLGSRVKVVGD